MYCNIVYYCKYIGFTVICPSNKAKEPEDEHLCKSSNIYHCKGADWLSPLLRGVMHLVLQVLWGGQLRFSLYSQFYILFIGF